jgi:hypothetical protein
MRSSALQRGHMKTVNFIGVFRSFQTSRVTGALRIQSTPRPLRRLCFASQLAEFFFASHLQLVAVPAGARAALRARKSGFLRATRLLILRSDRCR